MFTDSPPFISYAQNFEDVMLWRVLRFLPKGFYIDVGANDPIDSSVTRAFYERGWRGVNVEPVRNYYEALCADRPHDVNVQLAVGDQEGEIEFYEMPNTGLSTADKGLADVYQGDGKFLNKYKVRTTTLTSIFEKYVDQDVHFLKIDVEGYEEQVLKGMDFQRWRPWILVIESPFDVEPPWRDRVLAAGYDQVYFDGLNGFYLAAERSEFKGAFELPPGDLDNFQLCYGHRFSYPVEKLEAEVAKAKQRAQLAEDQLDKWHKSRTFKLLNTIKAGLAFRRADAE